MPRDNNCVWFLKFSFVISEQFKFSTVKIHLFFAFDKCTLKACFSSQVLQAALGSCVNQEQAERPEAEVSLPWVHLIYQRFRGRLQNLSRILTIFPQILQVLFYNTTEGTWNVRLDGHELVWPLVGTVCAQSQGLAFLDQVACVLGPPGSCVLHGVPRQGRDVRNTSASCLLGPRTRKVEAPSLEHENTLGSRPGPLDLALRAVTRGGGAPASGACSLFPQTLDALAAVACTELLTRDVLQPSPQAWLQMVKNLSVPLDLLGSEGYLRSCGRLATGVIREVR